MTHNIIDHSWILGANLAVAIAAGYAAATYHAWHWRARDDLREIELGELPGAIGFACLCWALSAAFYGSAIVWPEYRIPEMRFATNALVAIGVIGLCVPRWRVLGATRRQAYLYAIGFGLLLIALGAGIGAMVL